MQVVRKDRNQNRNSVQRIWEPFEGGGPNIFKPNSVTSQKAIVESSHITIYIWRKVTRIANKWGM